MAGVRANLVEVAANNELAVAGVGGGPNVSVRVSFRSTPDASRIRSGARFSGMSVRTLDSTAFASELKCRSTAPTSSWFASALMKQRWRAMRR